MLEKLIKDTQVTVTHGKFLNVRRTIQIMDNGALVSESIHREVLSPGADLSGQPEEVVTIAQALWTPNVIDVYKAELAK